MHKLVRLLPIIILVFYLTACSLLTPANITPPKQFLIDSFPNIHAVTPANKQTLLVQQLQTSAPYNSNQIAYMTKQHQIAYFAKHEWAALPSDMLTPLVARTIRQAKLYNAVVTPPFIGNTDLRLATQLLTFQQEFGYSSSTFHIVFAAQLINGVSNKIIKSQQWDIQVPTELRSPEGGVYAANRGFRILLTHLIHFLQI